MRSLLLSTILVAAVSIGALAQTAEVTATCRDGTNWSGTSRRGACSGHGGVQAFGGTGTGPAPIGTPSPAAATVPPATAPVPSASTGQQRAAAAAPGGGT